MHYLRAAFALLTAMTFSPPALAETHRAIAVITGNVVTEAPPDRLGGPYAKQITRYVNTRILGEVEYDPVNCKFIESGKWTIPTKIDPQVNGKDPGTVDNSQTFDGHISGGPCDGLAVTYAVIAFKWTLRKNSSVTPNPQPDVGPTARFVSHWKTVKSNDYDDVWTFDITVPVVRPSGETTHFDGFTKLGFGTVGQWTQTLTVKGSDAPFDFSGEKIKERFVGGIPTTCPVPDVPAAHTTNSGSPFGEVREGNQWGPDGVGFGDDSDSECGVAYAHCKAPSGCGLFKKQIMMISSPADNGKLVDYLKEPNTLIASTAGRVISTAPGTRLALGWTSSSRGPNGTLHVSFLHGISPAFACPQNVRPQLDTCK